MKIAMIAVAGLAGVASAQTADTFRANPATPYNAAEYRPFTGSGIGGLDAVLWDNGGLGTGATSRSGVAAPAGTQWSEVPAGFSSAGALHSNASTLFARVGDDFTVSGGGWNVTQLCFYAYQTGSSTTSSMTNVNWDIYRGPVGDTTDLVASGSGLDATSFTGIYRIFDSNPGTSIPGTTRPVMLNEVNVNVSLPDGNYWVAWDTQGSLGSGPWAPSVTPQPSSANAVQRISGTWNPLTDGGAQQPLDLPFQVKGTVIPAPASLALVGLGGLLAGRRRR